MVPITQAANAAVLVERTAGFPAEVALAQFMVETEGGKVVFENNCFGVKAQHGVGNGRQLLRTREWFTVLTKNGFLARGGGRTAEPHIENGKSVERGGLFLYDVRDYFATFATLKDAFDYHGRLLQKGPYAFAWKQFQQDRDLTAYVRNIGVCYSTTTNYADAVIQWMENPELISAIATARGVAKSTQR